MNSISVRKRLPGLSRLGLLLSLSRTPHALLDMATPGLAALLWLGSLPPPKIILVGLITVFAGYTAVYALNDLVDHRVDRKRVQQGGFRDLGNYLDALLVRHPIAQGLLSLREGVIWVIVWSCLALLGAYVLNPLCAVIFLAGCFLESVYCLMWKVSPLKAIVSGMVKTSGGIAAVFAVDQTPSLLFGGILFLWLFFWEIGGQNVPADWADIEEDRLLHARTIPVRLGPDGANKVIIVSLILTVGMNILLLWVAPAGFEPSYVMACLLAGIYLLLLPAYRLHKSKARPDALSLFNRASYYPLALLGVMGVRALI